jgi:hypothetical protein
VPMTAAINKKNFETESLSTFCLEDIGLQYTLLETLISTCRQTDIRPTFLSVV